MRDFLRFLDSASGVRQLIGSRKAGDIPPISTGKVGDSNAQRRYRLAGERATLRWSTESVQECKVDPPYLIDVVAACTVGSLAVVHLRAGDVIRKMNDCAVYSNKMLQENISESARA